MTITVDNTSATPEACSAQKKGNKFTENGLGSNKFVSLLSLE